MKKNQKYSLIVSVFFVIQIIFISQMITDGNQTIAFLNPDEINNSISEIDNERSANILFQTQRDNFNNDYFSITNSLENSLENEGNFQGNEINSENDENHNRIDDSLEKILQDTDLQSGMNSQNDEEIIQTLNLLISSINNPFSVSKVEKITYYLETYYGSIITVHSTIINPADLSKDYISLTLRCKNENIPEIFSSILTEFPEIISIKENPESISTMSTALMQTQIYPSLRNDYGLSGDNSSAIAIIDSGIDDSHPMIGSYGDLDETKKIIGWIDFSDDDEPMPYDTTEHGTFVASVAAGLPYLNTDSENRMVVSRQTSRDYSGLTPGKLYLDTPISFNVTNAGQITVNGSWEKGYTLSKAVVQGISIIAPNGTYLINQTITDENINTIVNYDVTSENLGVYKVGFFFNVTSGIDYSYNLALDAHYPIRISDPIPIPQGVAPDAKIVLLKARTSSEIIEAIDWIIDNGTQYNITTVNMSFKINNVDVREAAEQLAPNGFIPVAAAGNDYASSGNTAGSYANTPASIDSVISVGAIDNLNHIASYSSAGGSTPSGDTTKPDCVAPGGDFATRFNESLQIVGADSNEHDYLDNGDTVTDRLQDDMKNLVGTSFSSAYVSGVTQLIIEAMGGINAWDYSEDYVMMIRNWLLMTSTETAPLTRNVQPEYSPTLDRGEKDTQEGYGRINPMALIDMITNTLAINSSISQNLASSDTINISEPLCFARNITLNSNSYYTFNLTVPDNADYDIYIYNENGTKFGEPIIEARSINTNIGDNEWIQFSPEVNGTYFLVIKGVIGSGEFQLNYTQFIDYIAPNDVRIFVPSEGEFIRENYQFNVLFEDAGTGVRSVEIFLKQLDNETKSIIINEIPSWNIKYSSIFSINTEGIQDGWYSLILGAIDGNFNMQNSTEIVICIDNTAPEYVKLTEPIHNEEYYKGFSISGEFSDSLSGVDYVEVHVNSRNPSAIYVDNDPQEGFIDYSFYSEKSDDGFNFIWIKVYDNAGNSKISQQVQIIVKNAQIEKTYTIITFVLFGVVIIVMYKIAENILININFEDVFDFPKKLRKKIYDLMGVSR